MSGRTRRALALLAAVTMLAGIGGAPDQHRIYLPIVVGGGDDMSFCTGDFAELFIETRTRQADGSYKRESVDLLSPKTGFCVTTWEPRTAAEKGGGVWQDSSLAHGRKLVMRKRDNIQDVLTLACRQFNSDALIREVRLLRQMLEKAAAWSTTDWLDEPVWIRAVGKGETTRRYSIIYDYVTPSDGYPYGEAFWQAVERASFPSFPLTLEHEDFWRTEEPGTGMCVQASGTQKNWEYEGWTINSALPAAGVRDIIELEHTANRMLAGETNEVWRTDDGGATPWLASAVPPNIVVDSLVELPNGNIIASGSAEVWRSVNGGVNWVQRTALHGTADVKRLTYCEEDGYLYMADIASTCIARSNDEGATWNCVLTGDLFLGAVFVDSNGVKYASIGPTLYRSEDGVAWTPVLNTVNTGSGVWEPGDGYLYANGGLTTLYQSLVTDGVSWSRLEGNIAVVDLIQRESADGSYYATSGTGAHGAHASRDCVSWKRILTTAGAVIPIIEYSGNDQLYVGETGDIYSSGDFVDEVGIDETCNDDVFVSNKQNVAQITDIYVYDATGPTWTAQFPAAVFPYDLLPDPFAVNDAVYFGIRTAAFDSGPFDNLVFDIGDFLQIDVTSDTVRWEYWNGAAWAVLDVYDETNGGQYPFQLTGVNSVHWRPPSDWATTTVGPGAGIAGWWVRVLVQAMAGAHVQTPTQQNRDIYTCNRNHVEIDDLQVEGDLPTMILVEAHNRSDEDGYEDDAIDDLDMMANRVIVSGRKAIRGAEFVSCVNLADEQNPIGINVTAGTGSAFANDIRAPSGRILRHTTTGNGLDVWDTVGTVTYGPSISADYYGEMHAFIRAQLEEPAASPVGDYDDVRVRIVARTGSGGISFTSEFALFTGVDANTETYKDFALLDLLSLTLPVSSAMKRTELPDQFTIDIQVASAASTNLYVNLYDLWTMPVDEWAGDFVDSAITTGAGGLVSCNDNGHHLTIDSVENPKENIRALVRTADASEFVKADWQEGTPERAQLQAREDQSLHFLAARGIVMGEHDGGAGQASLTDSMQHFPRAGVKATGQMIVYNVTDGTYAIVTGVDENEVEGTLSGGTWDNGDVYFILCPNWRSEPWICHSIAIEGVHRYISMVGEG